MQEIIKNLSLKNLKNNINKYGYKYSTKDFIIETLIILLVVFSIAYISQLQIKYILVLVGITIFVIPLLTHAWFSQNYNMKKFQMLTDYLTNIIPIFTQKTKIRYTLGELLEITNGKMKETIAKAIKYLDTTVNDPQLLKNSLNIIEEEFPNSRVKSVHKLLLTIESQNSIDYEDICQNMYEDIEQWIKRVYTFQKELKNRRNKLLILCTATLVMNSLFIFIYVSNDAFAGFTDSALYQITTFIFISLILIVITIVLTKLHGSWLINDIEYKKNEKIKDYYEIYKNGKERIKIPEIILSIFCLLASVYLIIINKAIYIIPIMLIALISITKNTRKFKKAYKRINKAITIEFPIWLREISLNLGNLTVLNAIETSQNMASYPMRKEIRKFLNEAKKDPTSIKPYNTFLSDFDLEDAKSSMKVLYSIQNIGRNDVKKRVSNLIIRNQDMLNKAETLKNDDSIGGIEALGYVPTILFSLQMVISMFSMFNYMVASIMENVVI